LIQSIIQYAGSDQRQEDIFFNSSILARGKSVFKGLKGVENVYTQHTPYLINILEDLSKGKLKDTLYPFMDGYSRDRYVKSIPILFFTFCFVFF